MNRFRAWLAPIIEMAANPPKNPDTPPEPPSIAVDGGNGEHWSIPSAHVEVYYLEDSAIVMVREDHLSKVSIPEQWEERPVCLKGESDPASVNLLAPHLFGKELKNQHVAVLQAAAIVERTKQIGEATFQKVAGKKTEAEVAALEAHPEVEVTAFWDEQTRENKFVKDLLEEASKDSKVFFTLGGPLTVAAAAYAHSKYNNTPFAAFRDLREGCRNTLAGDIISTEGL